ncbi:MULTISPECIES: GNAT family N-acetyltransferase [unclassified Arthrobacter]|uniref:GNAT family N-acetyltransferase n=1 Tax=unclassified Arthrobacter TaxID=235627 RepID=UPI002DFDE5DA|nr:MULTISPECIES: GNAT family protein [unclassified Arthrobacter]MEC5190909.1 ribosomal-protein-alanine N-acetyltransferase [Arthrobacter sp. MP_M4]MEC5202073.1 ribosomal-protein-alanine N-acetyltransferase [Arthrobacter sp. MP_M7]
MSPTADPYPPPVLLIDVSGRVLEQLLTVAIQDADADEVTPPLGSATGWNSERISWFREYHLAAAALDGPAQEKTWAINAGGELAGSVRLKRTGADSLETGIWLGRGFRGRGVAREALRLVIGRAAASGAAVLEAYTTAGNTAALVLLRSAGAELEEGGASEAAAVPVRARIALPRGHALP